MNKEHVKLLCCPSCHSKLTLEIKKEGNGEIIEGSLTCDNCNKEYKIKEGVPVMI